MTATTSQAIVAALDEAETIKGRPTAIIAHTVKGKGISFAENNVAFHNGAMTQAQYDQALKEVDAAMAKFAARARNGGKLIMATYTNPRPAYGETLVELGKVDRRIVALDADLCKSTMSVLFQDAFPDRYFEMGIAEANMMSTAAGLALERQDCLRQQFRGVCHRPGLRPDSPVNFHRQIERENLRLVLRPFRLLRMARRTSPSRTWRS